MVLATKTSRICRDAMSSTDLDCAANEAALQAHKQHLQELRPGLHLHADASSETQYLNARSEVAAGLRIIVLLEGALDLSYGERHVQLVGTAAAPCACLVSVAQAEHFTRRLRPGVYSRRVNLGLDHRWVEQLCASQQGAARTLDTFRRQHLSVFRWQLCARSVALAEQIVKPPAMEPLLQSLYMESRSLELVSDAISTLHAHTQGLPDEATGQIPMRPRAFQRMREFHAF